MKHAFNIYPSLFILTPIQASEGKAANSDEDETRWSTETERYFTSCPQTYWGNCAFNDSHTQVMLSLNRAAGLSGLLELYESQSSILQPAKFKGKHYSITYIPVLN